MNDREQRQETRDQTPWYRAPGAQGGFALLITITLLAFLVVLLVGLASYLRVETAITSNTQRQTQARQNALLGLNVALGQLQKYAGPDKRVTATADAFPNGASTKHFTGVWPTDPADDPDADPVTPLTWLVSGNELQVNGTSAPLAITPKTAFANNATDAVELVGTHSTGTARDVMAKLQSIAPPGQPGVLPGATPPVNGRYAWWVGDQGVKAPVALGDPTTTASNFNYAPYDSAEVLSRVRQQISLGAGAATSAGAAVFEPRDTNNSVKDASGKTLVEKVTAYNQLAFLRNASAAAIGLAPLKTYFHAWSPNNFAVLANTKLGGLRQDLSLKPDLLGSAFAAWANYDPKNGGYMEDFTAPADPKPLQAYSSDPLRRRYRISPSVGSDGASSTVSPLLAMCGLSFNIRTVNGFSNQQLEVRARWYVSLWNPYTGALIPEDLRLEIEGLPDPVAFTITDVTSGATVGSEFISINSLFADSSNAGRPFPIKLQWPALSGGSSDDDNQSWLPGRVYTWISNPHSLTPTPSGGLDGSFYVTNFSNVAGSGDTRATGGPTYSSVSNLRGSVSFPGKVRLVAKLYRDSDTTPLASFSAPEFEGVIASTPQVITGSNYQFGFQFRRFESGHVDVGDKGEWLTSAVVGDPRTQAVSGAAFRVDPTRGNDPAQYQTTLDFSDSKFLLDRTQGTSAASRTYNEDVPLFELPRAPILSLGMLQHLAVPGQRPFAIGNSWSMDPAAPVPLNGVNLSEVFDRYFFSGLVTNLTPITVGTALQLPNPLLKPLPRNQTTSLPVTLADLQGAPTAQTSKFLLQGGAFNLNSVNPLAWGAVLRAHRFAAPASFKYLDADATTGTAGDDATATIQSSDAQFFRFSQSAQETYKAEPGNSGGTATTELFRQGMITVKVDVLSVLAARITDGIKARQTTSGPFRSLEEFLAPTATGSPSLIEQAIADAGVNANVAQFSSQFLTQGDIMTALAPVFFPRSDTFVIRAYGEALNPTTSTATLPVIEGRAWCEATVQRVPEYFGKDANLQPEETAPADLNDFNKTFGRRFKIVSFRWLTRSDI